MNVHTYVIAWETERDHKAKKILDKLVKGHDPQAMGYEAISHFPEHPLTEKQWQLLRHAAEQGEPVASHNLLLLEILFNKRPFDEEAIKQFTHFAEKNDLDAAWLNLGSLFYSPYNQNNDYYAAEACLAKLPKDPDALFQRGMINEREKNFVGAIAFYIKAKNFGSIEASNCLQTIAETLLQDMNELNTKLNRLQKNSRSHSMLNAMKSLSNDEDKVVCLLSELPKLADLADQEHDQTFLAELNNFISDYFFKQQLTPTIGLRQGGPKS